MKSKVKIHLALCLWGIATLLFPDTLVAQPSLILDEASSGINIAPFVQVYTQSGLTSNIDPIDQNLDFFENNESTEYISHGDGTVDTTWIKFNLFNAESQTLDVYLEANTIALYSYSVFKDSELGWEEFHRSVFEPRDTEEIHVNAITSRWKLNPGDNQFYAALNAAEVIPVEIRAFPTKAYIEHINLESSLLNVLRGITLGLCLFNLFIFVQTRDRAYLYFSILTIAALGRTAYEEGLAQSMWSISVWWDIHAYFFFICIYTGFGLLFHSAYLKLKESSPFQAKLTQWWGGFYILSALLYLADLLPMVPVITSMALVSPYVLGSAFLWAMGGSRAAAIYFIAVSIPTLNFIIDFSFVLEYTNIPANQFWVDRIGTSLSLILFAIGLADRINTLNSEKLTAEKTALEAKAETAAKSVFLAKISHEIRTPMNGLLGMSQLLMNTRLTTIQKQYNDIIYSSGASLLHIINDLLDFSKIEAGKMELEVIPFDVQHLVDDVAVLFTLSAQEKQVPLEIRITSEVPARLAGDPMRLRQILINLINNAYKFTEKGKVKLTITSCEQSDAYRFTVSDTGLGISKSNQEALFKSFSQVGHDTARKFGGTGLGLAICSQLIELMKGKLGVQSVENQGSDFWFELSLPEHSEELIVLEEVDTEHQKTQLNVLVAEDNKVNQIVIKGMLENLGHRITIKENGQEVLDAATSNHGEYDIVLMDCEMPVMDGYEASESLRAYEKLHELNPVPIIAVTAHATSDLRKKCIDVGMNSHLAKPIQLENLKVSIAEFMPH